MSLSAAYWVVRTSSGRALRDTRTSPRHLHQFLNSTQLHSVARRRAAVEEEKREEAQPSPHRHANEPPF